jgi:hypothetical protein
MWIVVVLICLLYLSFVPFLLELIPTANPISSFDRHDAVSGWLMLASFYYQMKQYNTALYIIAYALTI